MTMLIIRHVWVYNSHDKNGQPFLATFVSPDKNGVHLDTIATPFDYITSRGDVRYFICSEVLITREKAIEISRKLYDEEFSIESMNRRKSMKVRR